MIAEQVSKGKEVRVIQVGFQYYFVRIKITSKERNSVKGDVLTVQSGKAVQVYNRKALTKEEAFAFYKPEINRLLLLGGGYFCFISSRIIICIRKAVLLTEGGKQNYSNYEGRRLFLIFKRCHRYFDHLPAGKIVSRVTNDTEVDS